MSFLLAALCAAGAGGGGSDVTLSHLATVDLDSTADAANPEFIGTNPSAVAWDGTDLYVAGFNNGGAAGDTGIVKISDALGGMPNYGTAFGVRTTNALRGFSGLDLAGGTLASAFDNGGSDPRGIEAYDTAGTLLWSKEGRGGSGVGIDPGFGGADSGVAWTTFGSGRRALQDSATGADIYTGADGMVIFTSEGSFWRDMDFDDATGDVYLREGNNVIYWSRTGGNSTGSSVLLFDQDPDVDFVAGQNIAYCDVGGDFVVLYNDRPGTAGGQSAAGALQAIGGAGPLNLIVDGVTLADGNGFYDFAYDAGSGTLALLDFANRDAHLFSVSFGSSGPNGDTCADAVAAVTGGNPFDTTGLTDSGFHDGSCTSRDGFTDIWFTYTATASGEYTIDTCGADIDTVLRVLEGPDCSTLTCLVGNDDACATTAGNNFASSVNATLTAGNTYFIHIEGWGSSDIGAGTLTITPPPTGDTCAEALTASAGTNTFDTTALLDSGFHDASCVARDGFTDIWFTFAAAKDGVHTIDTCGSDIDTVLRVLEGPDCSTLTCLAGNDDACATTAGNNFASSVDVTLSAGSSYYIHIEGWGTSDIGAGFLEITEPSGGDTCEEALPLASSAAQNFDTSGFTASGIGTCMTSQDIWFQYTIESPFGTTFATCGSSYDTKIAAYTGDCSSLLEVACNDDACGLQSEITVEGDVGDTIYIQVGGFASSAGVGTILATPGEPPAYCVGTPTLGGNGGDAGGAVYVDLTTTQTIRVSGYYSNIDAPAGEAVSQTLYGNIADITHVGYEQDPTVWVPLATASGVSAGPGEQTSMRLDNVFELATGTYGVCIVNSANAAHDYTNGNGTNEVATTADGVVTITAGAGQNVPFSSTVFSPRIWNGGFCYDQAGIGTNYCTANANSTGVPASMSASGSTVVVLDQLVLEASDLPGGSLGFFLASQTQDFVANPGGSEGNLCLGGTIGRGMGDQVFSTEAGSIARPMGLALPFNLTGGIAPGDTWNFQMWFRDQDGTGMPTSNFTDGYSITFE